MEARGSKLVHLCNNSTEKRSRTMQMIQNIQTGIKAWCAFIQPWNVQTLQLMQNHQNRAYACYLLHLKWNIFPPNDAESPLTHYENNPSTDIYDMADCIRSHSIKTSSLRESRKLSGRAFMCLERFWYIPQMNPTPPSSTCLIGLACRTPPNMYTHWCQLISQMIMHLLPHWWLVK